MVYQGTCVCIHNSPSLGGFVSTPDVIAVATFVAASAAAVVWWFSGAPNTCVQLYACQPRGTLS